MVWTSMGPILCQLQLQAMVFYLSFDLKFGGQTCSCSCDLMKGRSPIVVNVQKYTFKCHSRLELERRNVQNVLYLFVYPKVSTFMLSRSPETARIFGDQALLVRLHSNKATAHCCLGYGLGGRSLALSLGSEFTIPPTRAALIQNNFSEDASNELIFHDFVSFNILKVPLRPLFKNLFLKSWKIEK